MRGASPCKYCTNLGKSIFIFLKIKGFNIKIPIEISAGFYSLVFFGLFKREIEYNNCDYCLLHHFYICHARFRITNLKQNLFRADYFYQNELVQNEDVFEEA
jgi:hypothetical protein